MSLLGETLDPAGNITGARVIDKSNPSHSQVNYRIEVWFTDWSNEEFKTLLQEELKELLKKCGCKSTDYSILQNDTNKYAKQSSVSSNKHTKSPYYQAQALYRYSEMRTESTRATCR